MLESLYYFFFQAEDGIRDRDVTGVQTCALPISSGYRFDGSNPGGFRSHPCTESPSAPTKPNSSSGFRSSRDTMGSVWWVSGRPAVHTSAGCVLLWWRYTTPRPSGITCTLVFTPPPVGTMERRKVGTSIR